MGSVFYTARARTGSISSGYMLYLDCSSMKAAVAAAD